MKFAWFAPDLVVVALNVAAAAVAFSMVGFVIAKMARQTGLPLQHGLLCAVVVLTLLSPLPTWLAHRCGLGLITIGPASSSKRIPVDAPLIVRSPNRDGGALRKPVKSIRSLTMPRASNIEAGDATSADDTQFLDKSGDLRISPVEMTPPDPNPTVKATNASAFQIVGSTLMLIWGTIAFCFGLRLIRALNFVRRIRRSLTKTSDARVITAAQVAFGDADIDSKTSVFESTLVPAPLTLGWRRSAIVMPRGLADFLDEPQSACILAHEVAHVARRDTLIALLQQFAAVVFWWNPLLRVVNRRISQLRERLCDDCVVMRYGDGTPLAESIVRVAEWSSTRMQTPPLSLALLEDFHDLEDRIRRLTQHNRTMTIRLSRRSATALCAFTLALGCVLMLPLVRAQDSASKPELNSKQPIPSKDGRAASDKPKTSSDEEGATALIDVSGHVRREDGEPIVGAVISLFPISMIDPKLGTTTTDAQGAYRFRNLPLPVSSYSRDIAPSGSMQIFCEAEGYGIAWHGTRHYRDAVRQEDSPRHREDFDFYRDEPIEMNLTMRKAKSLKGRIIDENGNPVANATVDLRGFDYLDTENREYHQNFREFWLLRGDGEGECAHIVPEKYHRAMSGADGRFEIENLSDETVAYVHVNHPQFAQQFFWAAITDQAITEYRFVTNYENSQRLRRPGEQHVPESFARPLWETRKVLTSPVDIRVMATRRVVVTVHQGQENRPVKNVRVSASSTVESLSTAEFGETDERGQVELKLPPGAYQLVANPPLDTDFVETTSEVVVKPDASDQSLQMQINVGCVVIFEAVDRDSGVGIPEVSFWWERDIDDGDGQVQKGRTSLQAQLKSGALALTNEIGELRAVVPPGTWRYGAPMGPVEAYDVTEDFYPGQLVECESGKTIRAKFKLAKVGRKASARPVPRPSAIQAPDSTVTTNSIGMKLVKIPAGEFMMGAEEDRAETLNKFPYCDPDWLAGEIPQHRVRITRSFDMGQFEVTVQQFQKFYEDAEFKLEIERDGKSGWGYDTDGKLVESDKYRPWQPVAWKTASNHPAIYVTWNDAVAFCQWLSHREGQSYRLPTEAEWEYACRAGSNHRFHFGDDTDQLIHYSNTCDLGRKTESEKRGHKVLLAAFENGIKTDKQIPFPYLSESDGYAFTAPVGQYRPNAFGLYDMHGNAREWCSDWFDDYSKTLVDDPRGPSVGASRVVRGGAFDDMPLALRCAYRNGVEPSQCLRNTGFRVVRER